MLLVQILYFVQKYLEASQHVNSRCYGVWLTSIQHNYTFDRLYKFSLWSRYEHLLGNIMLYLIRKNSFKTMQSILYAFKLHMLLGKSQCQVSMNYSYGIPLAYLLKTKKVSWAVFIFEVGGTMQSWEIGHVN